jgi:enoyl-CoA hydratase/carnithine racemase
MSDILVQHDGALATVVFNGPAMRNAINLAMRTEIAPVEAYLLGLTDARRGTLRDLATEATEREDYKEGTRTFLDKRAPRFQGR